MGPNPGNDLSSPDCGWDYQSSDDWWVVVFFFSQHTLQPVKQKRTDLYTNWLGRQTDKWERETRTDCNGKRQVVVSLCLFWYFSSVKILMNRLHVQKNPVAPWDFPNHCCWETQNINFIWTLKPHKFCTSVFFWLGYEKKKEYFLGLNWVWKWVHSKKRIYWKASIFKKTTKWLNTGLQSVCIYTFIFHAPC